MKTNFLLGLVVVLCGAGPVAAITYCQLDPATADSKYQQIFQPTCHNCYEIGVAAKLGAKTFKEVLGKVKNVEIDIFDTKRLLTGGVAGQWFVRHSPAGVGSGNDNNCTGNGKGTNNFGACLADIQQWSAANPDHDPITLFLDKKQGFSSESSQRRPSDLDQLIEGNLGAALYKPASLKSTYATLREAAKKDSWPTKANLAGKVIVVLTGDNKILSEYVADRGDQAALFVAANTDKTQDVEGTPNGFTTETANSLVFYNVKTSGTRDDLGKTTRANNYVSRLYGADSLNPCRVLANCINDNALDKWNTGACSDQSTGTLRLLDPNGFLPEQPESTSNFSCPAPTVMTGRWHDCRNKDPKCDENGNSSVYCRKLEYNGQAFGVGTGSWSGDVKESAGTAYLCPKDTVMTGRRHNCGNKDGGTKCDENGNTQYQCSPLTYGGKAVTVDPNAGSWSSEITESTSQFVCPDNQILNGRKHTGDENGQTSYHCLPVPTPAP